MESPSINVSENSEKIVDKAECFEKQPAKNFMDNRNAQP